MVQCRSIASGCMALRVACVLVEYLLMPGSAVYWVGSGAGWMATIVLSLTIGFFVLLLCSCSRSRLSAVVCGTVPGMYHSD